MLWLYAFIAVWGAWIMLRLLGGERQSRRCVLVCQQRLRLHHERHQPRERARA